MAAPRFPLALTGNFFLFALLAGLAAFFADIQSADMLWVMPPSSRLSLAVLVLLAYAGFCLLLAFLRSWREGRIERAAQALLVGGGKPWLVAYASQTGFAEQLAWQTADALQRASLPVRLLPLAKVDADVLAGSERALFLASTTGEGDAPDTVAGFMRRVMAESLPLWSLQYGLLALGDRGYDKFCAFGRSLDDWLRHQGAQALFDRVEVDNGDAGALRHWQHHLSVLTGNTDLPDWSAPGYEPWQLLERRCVNPGSQGAPVFHVALTPMSGSRSWRPGDIAEVGPCNADADVQRFLDGLGLDGAAIGPSGESLQRSLARLTLPHDEAGINALAGLPVPALLETLKPLPHREYSIASIPEDGRVELLLRQMRQPDGRLGVGSGWLTENAPLQGEVALRIRENRGFHPPVPEIPLILIGNGTGLAGLRAHLKARSLASQTRNWLLFGERNEASDFFYREEILSWQQSGLLERLDLAFSRDQAERIYVQDRLRMAADSLRDWVAAGAAIYVCGSLAGMAPAVAAVLADVLGEGLLEQMAEDGRYRRDVY